MLLYGNNECFVMYMFYICVLYASCVIPHCCILHDLMLVDDARGGRVEEETYSRLHMTQTTRGGYVTAVLGKPCGPAG